jgi:hypothetical protein
MINFQVYTLCHTLWLLRYEERALQLWVDKGISPSLGQPSGTPQFVPDTYKDHLKAVVNHGKYVADQLQFEAVHDRVNIFTGKVKYPMTIPEAIAELMVIREAIDTGIRPPLNRSHSLSPKT